MKYIFILTFFLVYAFLGLKLGYTATSPWYTHITYSFQHASIMHLLINSFAFWTLYRVLERYISSWHIAIIALFTAISMSFFASYIIVVVGASGMIYTMMGMYFFLVSIHKIHFKDKTTLIVSIISVITFLIISFLKHNSAGMLHLLCLSFGYFITVFYWLLNKNL